MLVISLHCSASASAVVLVVQRNWPKKQAAPTKIVGAPPSTSSRALIRGPNSDNASLAKEDTCLCHAAISDKAKEKRGNR